MSENKLLDNYVSDAQEAVLKKVAGTCRYIYDAITSVAITSVARVSRVEVESAAALAEFNNVVKNRVVFLDSVLRIYQNHEERIADIASEKNDGLKKAMIINECGTTINMLEELVADVKAALNGQH